MTRARLVAGLIMITLVYFAWNFFHPGAAPEMTRDRILDGSLVRVTLPAQTGEGHISKQVLLGAFVVWYLLCWINIVDQRYRRPVMRFGKYVRTLDGGISFLEPIIHNTLEDLNVQDTVIEVAADEVQTKDNVSVGLVGTLTYRIDPLKVQEAVLEVDDVDESIELRALSTLTDVSATKDIDSVLEHRDQYCRDIKDKLQERVGRWGGVIQAFELKSFEINDEAVEQAIAMKARAAKEGAAELVRAQMQSKIAEELNQAAKKYDDQGRWLKCVETLTELCRSGNNNTILLPTNLVESLAKIPALAPR